VSRAGLAPSRGGRPSNVVTLSERLRYVGVDVGATSLALGITNGFLEVLDFVEEAADVRDGPQATLSRIVELTHKLTAQTGGLPIAAVGVGVPGPVSFRDGRSVSPPLMPGWHGYPIRDHLSQSLGVPVTVDNDVNIMALGERHAGVARGASDFLFVKIGTGIGCGVVVRGALHRGVNGCAGDIGHIRVVESSTLCHCGRTGCLESDFGGVALARKAAVSAHSGESPRLAQLLREKGRLTAEDVGQASIAGDAVSIRLVRDGGQLTGQVLAGLINFFNPSIIVIGGGLANLGHALLAEIRSVTIHRSTPLATSNLSIVLSELGDRAGVVGAAWLASEPAIAS
jgi:glucokinase-like ROK family protein